MTQLLHTFITNLIAPNLQSRYPLISFDTNFLVRYLVDKGLEQENHIKAVYERCREEQEQIFIGAAVLVETVWVLQKAKFFRLSKKEIISVLTKILYDNTFLVESENVFFLALNTFQEGKADFSDYVIYYAARQNNALPLYSFDKGFRNLEGVVNPQLS